MTPEQFTAALDSLGWTQIYLARLLGKHPNTVNQWALGRLLIPRYVVVVLEMAQTIKRAHSILFTKLPK